LIQVFLNSLLDDSHVVNIAGRQRMLTQKLSKTAVLLFQPQVFQVYVEDNYQEISEIITLWEASREGLKNKNLKTEGRNYAVKNSDKIDQMFRKNNSFTK
jgi:hypothetical protein